MLYQRLLACIACGVLGEGFTRHGAHIAYFGDIITFADRCRFDQTVLLRLGFYLPQRSASTVPFKLTAMRLPASISEFSGAVLQGSATEHQQVQESHLAGRLRATVRE